MNTSFMRGAAHGGGCGAAWIAALLDTDTLRRYIGIATGWAVRFGGGPRCPGGAIRPGSGGRVVGVNNRDLRTFEVDLNTCLRLRDRVPVSIPLWRKAVSARRRILEQLRGAGVNAVLIGETLMRSPDKKGGSGYPAGSETADEAHRRQNLRANPSGGCRGGERCPAGLRGLCICRKPPAGRCRSGGSPAGAAGSRYPHDRVFVNESTERIVELCRRGIIGIIQLRR